jgi:hypothetical protein
VPEKSGPVKYLSLLKVLIRDPYPPDIKCCPIAKVEEAK